MIHDRRDGCRIYRPLCLEGFDVLEWRGVKQLCIETMYKGQSKAWFTISQDIIHLNTNLSSTVFGGCDERCEIHRCLDVIDLLGVFLCILQNLPWLNHTRIFRQLISSCITTCKGVRHKPWRWTGWFLHFRGRRSQTLPVDPTPHSWSWTRYRVRTDTGCCPLQEKIIRNHNHMKIILCYKIVKPTDLLGVSQVKVVEIALVTHLFVCGKHDDVSTEVKAACSHRWAGLQQS